jgi:16S rRNA (adenine1518-N6/adenine1519-N6)-dimethyltransferase
VDPVLVHYLQRTFQEAVDAGRLQIIEGDVLKTDLPAFGPKPVIAGNLPYYITSPILEKVFTLDGEWSHAVFLVQDEVAARITAEPGTRDFGYLSVLVQAHAQAFKILDVPHDAFRPPPKVESAVISLTPRSLAVDDMPGFLKFAQTCFRQKRKTLRNNLAPTYGPAIEAMPEAKQRAEQLGVAELAELFRKIGGRASARAELSAALRSEL